MFGQAKAQGGPGLSINTASANSLSATSQPQQIGGLFASMQQTKPAGSVFGSPLNTSQPQQMFGAPAPSLSGGLLSQGANNQQQAAGSLFGGLSTQPAGSIFAPQQNQQQQGASLFGASGQQNQPQSGGGSLFGGSISQQPQPQQNSGLFASFGQNQTQGQPQPQQSGGPFPSFGQNQTQGQPQQAQGGLFGASNQNRASSIFQNATNQQQASTQQPTSIFSTSIGQYSQQHQTIPGVRISINELRPTTRFNDLHEELQKTIEDIDNFILGQMKLQAECETLMTIVDTKSSPIANDVEYCQKSLETLQIALENDAEAIAHAKTLVTTDAANAKLSFKIIQALKTPQHFHHFALWQSHHSSQPPDPSLLNRNEATPNTNLVSYFSETADNMSQTLNKYKANIAEVETYLRGLEVNLGHQVQQIAFTRGRDGRVKNADDQVRELAAVLREFEAGILGVAGKVGGAREKVQELILA